MILAANTGSPVQKTRPRASFFFLLLVVALGVITYGCAESRPQPFFYAGSIMGTTYHVKVVALERELPESLADDIQAVLASIDNKMSTYKPDSELSELNRAPMGKSFTVSKELLEVLLLSREVYEETHGAFDPTVGPLVDLWGFGPSYHEDNVPDKNAIGLLLGEVGFDSLQIDEQKSQIVKTKTVSLDLSAVAKGYAADAVGELLDLNGLSNYMVEVGGEMVVSGRNDRGIPWQIAIEKPDSESRSVQQIISVSEGGIATSGDYRNYFEKGGVRYSHTLDPRTGYPINHALASVTVVTANSGLSDALATAFMVMGTKQALAFAEQENVAVFTLSKVKTGFEPAHSSAFERYLKEVQ